ncbi:TonB-dependent receptor domain-containing protein [Parvularcula marina]|uniref:TonB-dependent receptor domain-containing protein n=1 Tax=Parvularcula marina TaxID=2292771 RepID=UPI0035132DCB
MKIRTEETGRTRVLTMTSALALVMAGFMAAPASAQDDGADDDNGDTVVVTGSRVARDTFTAESPVTVISGEALQLSGDLDLGEVLRKQLAVGDGGFTQSNVLSGGGAQSVDLRSLGADRTLNLINGRRVASFADSLQNEAADLSFIPQAMVERIEILRDGASAVYGADAVSGVVNIILKDNFEGFEVSGFAGRSTFDDRDQLQVQAVLGTNFDRGNIVFSAEYNYAELVPQTNRDWAVPTISFIGEGSQTIANGSSAHPGGAFIFDTNGDGVFSINSAFAGDDNFFCTLPIRLGGDEITDVGLNGCPSFAPSAIDELPEGRYDYALEQSILNGSEVINIATTGHYDLNENVRAFLEFQYSDRESVSKLDGNPFFQGNGPGNFPNVDIPGTNPYNPYPGEAAQLYRLRPSSTVGTRRSDIDASSMRMVFGLQGEDLWDRFNWELSYLYSEVDSSIASQGIFNMQRLQTIVDPALCAADPVCVSSLQPGSLGALDVYRPGNWSQSEINYFGYTAESRSRFTQEAVSGFIGGDIFELPAGPLGAVIGFDYREETVDINPDSITESGVSIANQTFSTKGAFDTYEVFGELNIPLLKDVPLVDYLSLNLQGRAFEYSNFGSDSVYKVGVNWTVTDELRIRSTLGTAFRAPTLVDVFSGGTVGFFSINDPCSGTTLTGPEGTATRLANCASAGPLGVPMGYQQPAQQLPVLGGGDLADGTFDLEPELAETFTFGVIYSPSFISGLRVSADYYDIEVDNFISVTDLENEILDVCYDSPNLSDPTCSLITRDANGNLQNLTRTPINRTPPLETSGIDWAVDYSFNAGPGVASLSHRGTYVLEFSLFPGEGNYGGATTGQGAVPEYRLTGAARYDWNNMFGELRANYTPEMDDVNYGGDNALGYDVIDSLLIFDAVGGWEIDDSTKLSVGINNLTNEEPPYAFNIGANALVGVHGSAVVGRYYFARITKRF